MGDKNYVILVDVNCMLTKSAIVKSPVVLVVSSVIVKCTTSLMTVPMRNTSSVTDNVMHAFLLDTRLS